MKGSSHIYRQSPVWPRVSETNAGTTSSCGPRGQEADQEYDVLLIWLVIDSHREATIESTE